MSETDWVKPYINRLFSANSEKEADALLYEKMVHINMPFYKYCYVSEESKRAEAEIDYNIENFKKEELFFQNPANFNDPFDCFMGFSQVQLVRNLLNATLQKQHKYTPQMRKAINSFFSEEVFNPLSFNSITTEDWTAIVDALVPVITSQFDGDDLLSKYVISFITTLTNEENKKLFIKLIQNRLTVLDKQKIVDLMYTDEGFKEYSKSKLTNKDIQDTVLSMAQHDMKLKIETTPDSFLSDSDSETFQVFDFYQLIINMVIGKKDAPEFSDIKKQLNISSNEAMLKGRKIISEQSRVTCLSERMDSPLMWSHYANKHYGFCLEYDFTHNMIKRYPDLWLAKMMLFPVIYSDNRPLLSQAISNPQIMLQYMKTKKLSNDMIKNIIYGLLFKSKDWEYEQEWRIIIVNQDKPTLKLPPARKVFLGANMESSTKERIIEIAKSKRIPVYQMFLATDKYKFDYFKVD